MKKMAIVLALILASALGYKIYNNKEVKFTDIKLIPREILFGNPERFTVRLSPDGQYISYVSNLDGVRNIFISPINSPSKSQPITKDTDRGVQGYFWLYDNQHIAYLNDDGGDENWSIHVVNISTKEDKAFTPEKVNARIYHVSDKFPVEILIGLNERDKSYHDVYRLNILTGEKKLVLKNDRKLRNFVFDGDYKLRFAATTKADGGIEYFKVTSSKELGKYSWENFMRISIEDAYTTQLLGLNRDGNILYMLDSRGRDLNVLQEINLDTKVETVLAEASKADIGGIMTHPSTHIIQAYSVNYFRTEWTSLDKEIESHLNTIKQTLKGEINVTSRTLDDQFWIVAEVKDDGPVGYYLYQKNKRILTFLFNHREDLTKYKLAKMEGVIIKARDGLELPSYLTKPVDAKGPAPLVVIVHGGPVERDVWGYNPETQWLANRGYVVLQVNYRASTGFGKSFISKGDQEWGGKMHEDLLDAVSWAIKEGIADPTNVAIYGGSYGGYAALWAATHSGDVFKCAIDIVGRSNLQTYFERIPPYWMPYLEQLYQRVGDPRTEQGRALLRERSPLTHAAKIKIPVLIAHGEKDPRVRQVESEEIIAAMKAKGLRYVYMLFMDEGHGFIRPENKFAFYGIAERFLADNLGGQFESMTNELDKATLALEHKVELATRFK